MSPIRRKTVEGLKRGDTFSISRTFSKQDMIHYAAISRDYNPVHFLLPESISGIVSVCVFSTRLSPDCGLFHTA